MDWDGAIDTVTAAHPDVKVSQMFGVPCVKRDTGKVAFCSWQGDVVFKLVDEGARSQALALAGTALFDPGMGRELKEWVLVPAASADRWVELAGLSLAD